MQGIHCAFTARLGNDPEQRYTEAGKPLLPFGVVVDENITATADCPKTETLWLRVTC
jgi:single-stranded DNA-binding protein